MPLPFILGAAAALAGVVGVGSGISGAVKMKEANDTMEVAKWRHEQNIEKLEKRNKSASESMDRLGTLELNILRSFEDFCNTIEKIQNRPRFEGYRQEGVKLPEYDVQKLTEVSVGAGVLIGGLGGAALGTAGGFAAAGATTSAVMALGTASTGTAIASLSGAAATNATLAALGGGSLAAGGGGIALGTTMLGAATFGVGLLVGGVIFNITGKNLSEKSDEAYEQMKRAEKKIDAICVYLSDLEETADQYYDTLETVNRIYKDTFGKLSYTVNKLYKTDWNHFTAEQKRVTKNAVLLVQLLYTMCRVKLVNKSASDNDINSVNKTEVDNMIRSAKSTLTSVA